MIKNKPDIVTNGKWTAWGAKMMARRVVRPQYEIDDFLLNSKKRWKKDQNEEPMWVTITCGIGLAIVGYILVCGWLLLTNPQ